MRKLDREQTARAAMEELIVALQEFPDLRIGQLIYNAMVLYYDEGGPDLFNIENDDLTRVLTKFRQFYN